MTTCRPGHCRYGNTTAQTWWAAVHLQVCFQPGNESQAGSDIPRSVDQTLLTLGQTQADGLLSLSESYIASCGNKTRSEQGEPDLQLFILLYVAARHELMPLRSLSCLSQLSSLAPQCPGGSCLLPCPCWGMAGRVLVGSSFLCRTGSLIGFESL